MNKKSHSQYPFWSILVLVTMALLSGLFSCQKSGEATFTDQPVIEAYLAPGEMISVKITKKAPYDGTGVVSAVNLETLVVTIISGSHEYQLASVGNGVYQDTAGLIRVVADSNYILRFDYNGTPVSSTTLVPSKPQSVTQSVTSITMTQFDPENPDDSYYLATVVCLDTTLVPIYKDSIPANDMFSSQPTTGTEINIQPMMIRYFGLNRIILYHINPEYSTFFMRQASTSQTYQDPPTNVDNGLGIFTGVNADTLYLNVIQGK